MCARGGRFYVDRRPAPLWGGFFVSFFEALVLIPSAWRRQFWPGGRAGPVPEIARGVSGNERQPKNAMDADRFLSMLGTKLPLSDEFN